MRTPNECWTTHRVLLLLLMLLRLRLLVICAAAVAAGMRMLALTRGGDEEQAAAAPNDQQKPARSERLRRSFLLLLEGHTMVSRAAGQQEGHVSIRTQTSTCHIGPIPRFTCMETFQVALVYVYICWYIC